MIVLKSLKRECYGTFSGLTTNGKDSKLSLAELDACLNPYYGFFVAVF